MGFSILTPVSDGITKQYTINFPNGIYTRESVRVDILNPDDTVADADVPFTWINDGLIDVTTQPPAGQTVQIRRIMEKDIPEVDYQNGAILDELNLEQSINQVFNITQELIDGGGLQAAQAAEDSAVAAEISNQEAAASAAAALVSANASEVSRVASDQIYSDMLVLMDAFDRTYDNVASMVADTSLDVGMTVSTRGYYVTGDGGANTYLIVASATGVDDGGLYIDLSTHQAQGLFSAGFAFYRQFGAVGDGVVDDTVTITACMAASKVVNIGRGRFLTTGVNTGVCNKLFGYGNESVIYTETNSTVLTINSYDFDLFDFVIEGDYDRDGGVGSPSTKTSQTGIRNIGWFGNRISNVRGFKLGGYLYHLSDLASDSSIVTRMNQIHDCSAHQCHGGLWFDSRGEYTTVIGGIYEECDTGVVVGAGNAVFTGTNINQNGNNVHLVTGINDGHGIFSGCNINHADLWNILAEDITFGMTFDGCHIYEGNIWLRDSKGIHIKNGDLDVASLLFEGCTGIIANNLTPGAYGNVITNDRSGNPSLIRWIDNYDLEGQKPGAYGPYDGGYSRASLGGSQAIASDQTILWASSVDRLTNHTGFEYYDLYDPLTGEFTYYGIGSGQVSVNCTFTLVNVADPTTTSVWVQKNGVDYKRGMFTQSGTTLFVSIDTTVPCDDIGDTVSIYIKTTDAGGVDISSANAFCQVEGL